MVDPNAPIRLWQGFLLVITSIRTGLFWAREKDYNGARTGAIAIPWRGLCGLPLDDVQRRGQR
ncbi:MAG: hypothetical protein ACREDR_16760, partial [Blastocatellia bacterium]